MVEIKELYKAFGQVRVLEGINLLLDEPGIIAILGPNGSGKTTLIKSILGMVIPDKGSITIDENQILGKWAYRSQISYMSQIADFPQNIRVSELIAMIKNLRSSTDRDQALIDLFLLRPFLDKKLGNLSGGTRQKVNILLSFMFDAPLIILDEPTTGLDPVALLHLKDILAQEKQKGKTILITTHIMNLVEEIADRVIFLLDGKIYFNGSVTALKTQTAQQNLEHAIAEILKSHA